jgi:hypothetical protein
MRHALAALLVLAAPSVARAQSANAPDTSPEPPPKTGDMVNSPPYAHWSQFRPGTSVTVREVVTLPDGSVGEAVITSTLISKSKDKLQVETLVTTGGAKSWTAASEKTRTTTEYPAKVRFEQFQTPISTGYSVREGKELLEVKGKKVETEWVEATTTIGDETTVEKMWTAKEIPGGVVKRAVTQKKGAQVVQSSTELVKYTAKMEPQAAH